MVLILGLPKSYHIANSSVWHLMEADSSQITLKVLVAMQRIRSGGTQGGLTTRQVQHGALQLKGAFGGAVGRTAASVLVTLTSIAQAHSLTETKSPLALLQKGSTAMTPSNHSGQLCCNHCTSGCGQRRKERQ